MLLQVFRKKPACGVEPKRLKAAGVDQLGGSRDQGASSLEEAELKQNCNFVV